MIQELENVQHKLVNTNGITLHTIFAGPQDGEPVLLLHGFPEFWYGWRHQIGFLAKQGFRVIAPDQRGYNRSDKPASVNQYRIGELARDVEGLITALGYQQVNLIGHDWGAAVAWWVATIFPERLKKLGILNVPYPTLMGQAYRSGQLRQLLKSWYIFYFQVPLLPDTGLRILNYYFLEMMLKRSSQPGTFTDEDLERYREAWAQPGALTAMLNWYRAAMQTGGPFAGGDDLRTPVRIKTPTLMLWGERDIALDKSLAQPSIDLCDNGRLVFFPNATHWVQHDEVDEVNRHLLEFLRTP
jgi:pimeloyl-ACP methyl ester carboxylesterase